MWVATRVAGPHQGGVKLSPSGGPKSKNACAKLSADKKYLDAIFPGDVRQIAMKMLETDGTSAVFVRDETYA